MRQVLKLLGAIVPLVAIIGVLLYVASQNQDIRNRAGSAKEFIQVTPLKLLKRRRAITRVVVNQLQPNLFYRLVLSVSYSPNPDNPPPPGTPNPQDRKKTKRIKDNKTYSFIYRLNSCYFIPHVSVKLYSRERGKKYQEVNLEGKTTTTELTPPCSVTLVNPTPNPQSDTAPTGQQPGQLETPADEPGKGTPKPEVITNGDIPEDSGEEIVEEGAEDIESLEDTSAMDAESIAANQEVAAPSPTIGLSGLPYVTSTPPSNPLSTPQPLNPSLSQPTPSPHLATLPYMTSTPQLRNTNTPIPTTIPQLPTATPELSSLPYSTATPVIKNTPSPQSLAILIPTPTNQPFSQPTNQPLSPSTSQPVPTSTPQSSFSFLIPTPTPVPQVPVIQESSTQQTTSFGSLGTTPTPTSKSSTSQPNPTSSFQLPTSTPQNVAPLADFAGRALADSNATPTPFPVFRMEKSTPTSLLGQLAKGIFGGTVDKPTTSQQNSFVPEAPKSESTWLRFVNWISELFLSLLKFIDMIWNTIKGFFDQIFNVA